MSQATTRLDGTPALKPKLTSWLKSVASLAPDRGDPTKYDIRERGGYPCESEFGPITKIGQQLMANEFGHTKSLHKYAYRAALLSGWITPGWHVHAARLGSEPGRRVPWNSRPRIVELNTTRLRTQHDWAIASQLMTIIYNSITPTVKTGEQVDLDDLPDFIRAEVPVRFFASLEARDAIIDHVVNHAMFPARDCMVSTRDNRMLRVLTALNAGLPVPEDFAPPVTPEPVKAGELPPAVETPTEEQPAFEFDQGDTGALPAVGDLVEKRRQRDDADEEAWAHVDALTESDPDLMPDSDIDPAESPSTTPATPPRRPKTSPLGLPLSDPAATEAPTGVPETTVEPPDEEEELRRKSYALRDRWAAECAQEGRPLTQPGPKANAQKQILQLLSENRTDDEILAAFRRVLEVEGRNSPPGWMLYNALAGTHKFAANRSIQSDRVRARVAGESAPTAVESSQVNGLSKAERLRQQRERLQQRLEQESGP